ncbi:hypothetical protein ACFL2D_01425 [Patescibacteria group bacterium]
MQFLEMLGRVIVFVACAAGFLAVMGVVLARVFNREEEDDLVANGDSVPPERVSATESALLSKKEQKHRRKLFGEAGKSRKRRLAIIAEIEASSESEADKQARLHDLMKTSSHPEDYDDLLHMKLQSDILEAVIIARQECRDIIERLEPHHISGFPSLLQQLKWCKERAQRTQRALAPPPSKLDWYGNVARAKRHKEYSAMRPDASIAELV